MEPGTLESLLSQQRWIRRLALALVRSEAEADELVQDAWLALLRSRTALDPERGPRGFIATILFRIAGKRRRESARRDRRESTAAIAADVPSPKDAVAEFDQHRALVDAILTLDEPYRDVIILRWFKDLTPTAIARERGVPLATVATRLQRAHQKLRDELTRRSGGDSRSWVTAFLPIAAREHAKSGVFAIQLGVLAMSTSGSGILAAAAAVLLAVGAGLWLDSRSDEIRGRGKPTALSPEAQAPALLDPATAERTRVETSGSVPAATSATTCRVRIVDAFDRPVEGAYVLVDDETFEKSGSTLALTDENGEAEVARVSEATDVYVCSHSIAPSKHRVDLSAERCRIRLDRGAVIEGTVLVDEAPPTFPVRVSLWFPRTLDIIAKSSDRVRAFGLPSASGLYTDVSVAKGDGHFEFSGLDPDSEGKLTIQSDLVRFEESGSGADGGSAKIVRAPKSGIVFHLLKARTLSGIIRDPEGEPAAEASVVISAYLPDSTPIVTKTCETSKGIFEFALDRLPDDGSCHLVIEAKNSRSDRVVRRFDGPFTPGQMLPPLTLERASTFLFHAQDEHGAPIPGAIACFVDRPQVRSEGADANGDGSIATTPDGGDLLVIAPRYDAACVLERDARSRERFVVTLHPATRVHLRLEPREATWPQLFIGVSSRDAKALADRRTLYAQLRAEGGNHTFDDDPGLVYFNEFTKSNGSGEVILDHLTPRVKWDIVVFSPNSPAKYTDTSIVLEPGEGRDLVLRVESPPKRLSGRLVDRNGKPVFQATLNSTAPRGVSTTAFDRDGRFDLVGIDATRIDLIVVAPGFATKRVVNVSLVDLRTDIEIVLDPESTVVRTVQDDDGRVVRGARLVVDLPRPDGSLDDELPTDSGVPIARERSDGSYLFDGLAAGTWKGHVEIGGSRIEFSLDTSRLDDVIRVPSTGSLVVHLDSQPAPGSYRLHLVPIAAPAPEGRANAREQVIGNIAPSRIREKFDRVVDAVLPGRYEVRLERVEHEQFVCVAASEATIVAHEASETTLRPR